MLDLNSNPPIDWDEFGEWEGPAHELQYDMVWSGEDQEDDNVPSPDHGVAGGSRAVHEGDLTAVHEGGARAVQEGGAGAVQEGGAGAVQAGGSNAFHEGGSSTVNAESKFSL
ncbi:hypothetical protein HU200_036855 [Digitaria exilis]|uniref:Uncharacterized protein n=1 Tax=Digitaria exilis TaxID=1010633 RepID=A0A835EJJ8_9POAL|nr:hypothetical protein HU200_036855 [Digitaria exilis]